MNVIIQNVIQEAKNNIVLSDASSILGIIAYVLQAWALFTIAERRGIKKYWMAWIPVANVWILGSISDQYQYVVKRKVKNKRKVLLGLQIAITAITVFLVVYLIVSLFSGILAMGLTSNEAPAVYDAARETIGALLVVILLALAMIVLAVIEAVYTYMALYDIFCSCEPKNSTLFLVLSLAGNFVIDGICCVFLMLCKDKDLGMPPRKPEVTEQIPQNAEE